MADSRMRGQVLLLASAQTLNPLLLQWLGAAALALIGLAVSRRQSATKATATT